MGNRGFFFDINYQGTSIDDENLCIVGRKEGFKYDN